MDDDKINDDNGEGGINNKRIKKRKMGGRNDFRNWGRSWD